jgi:ATP phosphoribosyltransferase regulatory subunit HisZ
VLGDAFSLKVNRPFFSQDKGRGEKRVNNLKFFDKNTLKLNPLIGAKNDANRFSKLIDEMGAVYGGDKDYIKRAMANIEEAKTEDEKCSSINAITKVHEFVESGGEFGTESRYIKKSEVKDYIKSK